MHHTRLAVLGLALGSLIPGGVRAATPRLLGYDMCRPSMSSLSSNPSISSVCSTPSRPELLERPRWRPPVTYVPPKDRELHRLAAMLERLCNIILSADDVALAEREATKIGPVFMDARGNMTRQVVLLRQETRELMLEYGMEPRPLRRKWQLQRRGGA
jgi:hypothetical protein